MKVIFLDYDGVFNNALIEKHVVYEKHVKLIKRIIEATGAFVVCISSNKNDFLCSGDYEKSDCYLNYDRYLNAMGIEIYDYTPFIRTDDIFMERELEIHAYLNGRPEITDFVIIEDDNLIYSLVEHQVFIETCDGIKEEHVKPAIDILNGKLGFYPPNYNREETLMERLKRISPDFQLENAPSEVEEIDDFLLKMQREMKDFN